MFFFWIIVLGLLATKPTTGQSEMEVQLVVPRYVERGSSATMQCRHNVRPEILFKVTWLQVDKGKFFEFINGRNPPFRNFTVDGGEIDWENSNQSQVTIKNVNFNLSGQFFCEVSTDTPIFTKPSGDELLSVFLPQTAPPAIKFRKNARVAIGEPLLALCNTTRARPAPHITWLLNGKKVDEKHVRTHHVYTLRNNRRPHQQHQFQQPQYYTQHFNQYHYVPHLVDRYDKSLRWSGNRPDDELKEAFIADEFAAYHHHHSTSVHNNPFSSLTNMHDFEDVHEIQQRNYDKKHMDMKKHIEMKKHRNSSNRKYRRHIGENALGILRSTLQSGVFGPEPVNNFNNELGLPPNAGPMSQLSASYGGRPLLHQGGGSGVAAAAAAVTAAQQEKGMFSLSQLNIELTPEHIDSNGRIEITCLSTIPTAVGQGEQFADYKTFSVKVEVDRPEFSSTSTTPSNIGMAALGNGSADSAAATVRNVNRSVIYVWTLSGALLLLQHLLKTILRRY